MPAKSLQLIKELSLPLDAEIIDIGGGDSHLVDHLLSLGFSHLTLLDISELSLVRTRERLKEQASYVSFICSDVTEFVPQKQYNLWHDRAAFHFLTDPKKVLKYLELVQCSLKPGGIFIISTFSPNGPDKCSGLPITQYSEADLKSLFDKNFIPLKCFEDVHTTPWESTQAFQYCMFKRKN